MTLCGHNTHILINAGSAKGERVARRQSSHGRRVQYNKFAAIYTLRCVKRTCGQACHAPMEPLGQIQSNRLLLIPRPSINQNQTTLMFFVRIESVRRRVVFFMTDYPLAEVTSLGVVPSDFFCRPKSAMEVAQAQSYARENNLPLNCDWLCTNLLIRDGEFGESSCKIAHQFCPG